MSTIGTPQKTKSKVKNEKTLVVSHSLHLASKPTKTHMHPYSNLINLFFHIMKRWVSLGFIPWFREFCLFHSFL